MATLKFYDHNELRTWLRRQPREAAVAIAARSALRVLPLVGEAASARVEAWEKTTFLRLTAAVFRATALARVIAKYPSRANEFRPAAIIAARASDFAAEVARAAIRPSAARASEPAASAARAAARPSASDAFAAAAYAVGAAARAAARSRAVTSAPDSRSGADAALSVWEAVTKDAQSIEDGLAASALINAPLWLDGLPHWAKDAEDALKRRLLDADNWPVWLEWYEHLLQGNRMTDEYELTFARVPIELWESEEGWVAANGWIKEELDKFKSVTLPVSVDEGVLAQKPAPFSFQIVNGKIAVAPEDATAVDSEVAKDFYAEASRKAQDLRQRLERAQADERLRKNLEILEARLGEKIQDIRPGLLLSSIRSLESDWRAYDTEEGRKEHSPELLSMLADVAGAVRDLASVYPKTREIVANQLALEIAQNSKALDKLQNASDDVARAAETHPDIVQAGTVDALREPGASIDTSRTPKDRAGQLALRLLASENFVRIVAWARELAIASGDEVTKKLPKAVGAVAATGVVGAGGFALGKLAGPEGLSLLMTLAVTLAALKNAAGIRNSDLRWLYRKVQELIPAKSKKTRKRTAKSSTKKAAPKSASEPKGSVATDEVSDQAERKGSAISRRAAVTKAASAKVSAARAAAQGAKKAALAKAASQAAAAKRAKSAAKAKAAAKAKVAKAKEMQAGRSSSKPN